MLTALALLGAALVMVLFAGPRMAQTADALAEATGLGGALFGVVFLALATDLPEVTLTPAAVLGGTPGIAVGNLLGSAATQLVLIAVVDVVLREGTLAGHASLRTSLGQSALMVAVLSVPLVMAGGEVSLGSVGIGPILLVCTYLGVLAAIRGIEPDGSRDSPSVVDEGGVPGPSTTSLRSLWTHFVLYALLLAVAGVALESATETIGPRIGLEETAAGALVAGVVTSLPELVTVVAAARVGAVELAVGDLIGSSALDVALLGLADAFYTQGSIFELLGRPEITLIGVSVALVSMLLVGLARREPAGIGSVGVESYLMLVVYVGGAVVLVTSGG